MLDAGLVVASHGCAWRNLLIEASSPEVQSIDINSCAWIADVDQIENSLIGGICDYVLPWAAQDFRWEGVVND